MTDGNVLKNLAAAFLWDEPVAAIRACGNGLINDTFLVETATKAFIMQRINAHVFKQPSAVVANIAKVLEHMEKATVDLNEARCRPFQMPKLLRTREGGYTVIDGEGACWRAMTYIPGTRSFDTMGNSAQAREVGFALGYFQRMLSDFDGELVDTLPDFHIAPRYLQRYDSMDRKPPLSNVDLWRLCEQTVEDNREVFSVLEQAKNAGELKASVIHGDPKLNNFLFDEHSDEVVSLIDLDTVKPGLIHYDLGDCMRSCCNRNGESADEIEHVTFDLEICEQILAGYLQQTKFFFTAADYRYLFHAILLLPLELGLRFFNDYLSGNQYFKIDYPGHNLHRAAIQFQLVHDIKRKQIAIKEIIDRQQN